MEPTHLTAGDTVRFGRYPQGSRGQTAPIDWRVLDVREDRALLLAQRILDVQPFAGEDGSLFWGDCRLRAWLEEAFTPRAFSAEERARIFRPVLTEYSDVDRSLWRLFAMDDVTESVREEVFVLSYADVTRYFPGESPLFCPGASARTTDWVREQEGMDEMCWWLRSTDPSGLMRVVSPADSVGAGWQRQGVRPALWLRLS